MLILTVGISSRNRHSNPNGTFTRAIRIIFNIGGNDVFGCVGDLFVQINELLINYPFDRDGMGTSRKRNVLACSPLGMLKACLLAFLKPPVRHTLCQVGSELIHCSSHLYTQRRRTIG
jgi:hypothetical protein